MTTRTKSLMGASLLVLGIASATNAETASSTTELAAELASLRDRIAVLESSEATQWLDAKRSDEVRGLVREVLADADSRASLQKDGLTAGHDKKFFLANQDGTFRLQISGQIQARYIYNDRKAPNETGGGNPASADPNEAGFQIRRTKLTFEGYIGGPKIAYKVRLSADRNTDSIAAEVALLTYKFSDQLTLMGGRWRDSFMRESGIDDANLMAVERSVVENVFGNGFIEGVQLVWLPTEQIKLTAAFTDGARSGESAAAGTNDFNGDSTNFGTSARVDVKLAGDWKQADDFSAWTGETAIFLGLGGTYQESETGDRQSASLYDDNFRYSADVLIKSNGLSVFGSFVGQEARVNNGTSGGAVANHTRENFGAVLQAGYFVIPEKFEPFARYEWLNIDSDTGSPGALSIYTFGANYYLKKHAAKLTLDVVWAPQSVNTFSTFAGANSSQGLLNDASQNEDQVAIRAQMQLLF